MDSYLTLRDFLLYYITIFLAVVTGALLFLKLAEMATNVRWVIRAKEDLIENLHERMADKDIEGFQQLLQRNDFPFFPGNTFLTKWIKGVDARLHTLVKYLFRFPVLVLITSLSISLLAEWERTSCSPGFLAAVMSFLVFSGIWLKTFHLLIYRYRFGVADNYLLSLSVPYMTPSVKTKVLLRHALQKFVGIILSSIVTAIVGYAAIYNLFARLENCVNNLNQIDHSYPVWIQTLYFSTATFLTVGFGDISANGPIAQLLVTSEMILGLLLLIIFLTAFASTVPNDG
jgi:hypothetical protein